MTEVGKRLVFKLAKTLANLPIYAQALGAVLAYALMRVANIVLDRSYATSQYPVPFYVGQTAFSGETLKTYYAHMIKSDTLGIYWRTQFVDFMFIAAVFLAGLVVSLFLTHLHEKGTALYRLSWAAAIMIPLGATFDVFENLTSFIMLSQPTSFPNWIALVYSSFAVLKFIAIGIGYSFWAISLIGFLIVNLTERFRRSRLWT